MEPTILFEQQLDKIYWNTPVSVVGWVKDENVVYASGKGFANGEKYRQGSMAILEAMQTHKSKKLINNLVAMQVTSIEEQKWMAQVFLPMLFREKPLRIANVFPESIFGQLSLKKMHNSSPGHDQITQKMFSSLDEAYRWLISSEPA